MSSERAGSSAGAPPELGAQEYLYVTGSGEIKTGSKWKSVRWLQEMFGCSYHIEEMVRRVAAKDPEKVDELISRIERKISRIVDAEAKCRKMTDRIRILRAVRGLLGLGVSQLDIDEAQRNLTSLAKEKGLGSYNIVTAVQAYNHIRWHRPEPLTEKELCKCTAAYALKYAAGDTTSRMAYQEALDEYIGTAKECLRLRNLNLPSTSEKQIRDFIPCSPPPEFPPTASPRAQGNLPAQSLFDQHLTTWMQTNKEPWTENLGVQLRQAFPMEVLNSLSERDWILFGDLMIQTLRALRDNPRFDAETDFRTTIDQYFVTFVLPHRITPQTRAKISLTPVFQQYFPRSYAALLQERTARPQTSPPIPQPIRPAPPVAQAPAPLRSEGDQFPAAMNGEDKQKFISMGILFNSKGQVTKFPPQYRVEQENPTGTDNWHVTIFQGEQQLVNVNTKTTPYESYSRVWWGP